MAATAVLPWKNINEWRNCQISSWWIIQLLSSSALQPLESPGFLQGTSPVSPTLPVFFYLSLFFIPKDVVLLEVYYPALRGRPILWIVFLSHRYFYFQCIWTPRQRALARLSRLLSSPLTLMFIFYRSLSSKAAVGSLWPARPLVRPAVWAVKIQ